MKVLFIGNSHTFFNDMPELFARFCELDGEKPEVTMLAYPGKYLDWHMQEYFPTRFNILYGNYDYCIIQQGAHPFPEVESTFTNGKRIIEMCRTAGTKPVIVMTWAEKRFPENQQKMIDCYTKLAAETDAEIEKLTDECDRECQALIIRARSSAAMAKRNALLEARAKLIDDAYAAAEKQIKNMNGEQYLELLCKMLRSSLKGQLEEEAESLRLYGEDIAPASYEVVLNSRDRETYGEKLLAAYREGYGARLSPATLAKLRLAPDTAPIDGGIILRCGAVETNCSLAMLLAANRRETEVRVSRILFGDAN